MFHGVTGFRGDSGRSSVRPFAPLMLKDGEPPHRHTQPIPSHWFDGSERDGVSDDMSELRRRILAREPFSDDPNDDSLPNAWERNDAQRAYGCASR